MSDKEANAEVKAPEPHQVETKDMNTIRALRALGHVADRVFATAQPGSMAVVKYLFPLTAWTDFDRYTRGETLMVAISDYESADRELKNNIHRFSSQR